MNRRDRFEYQLLLYKDAEATKAGKDLRIVEKSRQSFGC